MGIYVRGIAREDNIACYVVDSTDLVARAEQIHKTSATVTAALGRLLTAASLMGGRLKAEDGSITLRINGDGPAGTLLAVSDCEGNVRGYVDNPLAHKPLNSLGKLDVAGVVGRQGTIHVMCDYGFGEPYIGMTPIVSGEIGEDISYYYATSEQVPTVCALGVLVAPDLTVLYAGGFIVQLLPGATDETREQLESTVKAMPPVTQLLEEGKTPIDIVTMVLDGFSTEILEEHPISYQCNCSRERLERALIALGREELEKLAEEDPVTELNCQFCLKQYAFSAQEVRMLIEEASS